MEAEIKYLNVTEKHFLNHLNFLQSMNQIETNKPASLYFTTESEDSDKKMFLKDVSLHRKNWRYSWKQKLSI